MNIQELSKQITIRNEVFDAVNRVQSITGKSIRFEIVDDLLPSGVLKAAREYMTEHIIYLRKDKIPYINHLITHECYHIFRFWSVEKVNRKIFSATLQSSEERKIKWKKELGRKGDLYPLNVFDLWDKGIMTLLYNAVTDTKIESSIHRDYPLLAEEQFKSLKALEKEVVKTTSKEVERMTPTSLFLLTNAMNYAYLKILEPITGRNWKKAFKGRTDITNLGNKLLKIVPEEDKGLIQDIQIINDWSKVLNLKGVKWLEFEDVPSGYELQY